MSSFNGGEGSKNPWSLDLNDIITNPTEQYSTLQWQQQAQYEHQLLVQQCQNEISQMRNTHDEHNQFMERTNQQNIDNFKRETEDRIEKITSTHNQQLESM